MQAEVGPPSPTGNPGRIASKGGLAGWYVPVDAIFNGTAARRAFLDWAVGANITMLYAQDFVGGPPNAGPEPNTTAAFCSFAQDAHAMGIDLHLFSALSLLPRDMAFIRACPMGQK